MNAATIIRAWKDPEFRASLTSEQREALPECPSGKPLTELDEGDLADIVGGAAIIFPTPPVYFTRQPYCTTKWSAVDACPTARLCPSVLVY